MTILSQTNKTRERKSGHSHCKGTSQCADDMIRYMKKNTKPSLTN
jgi:hypothetical protein